MSAARAEEAGEADRAVRFVHIGDSHVQGADRAGRHLGRLAAAVGWIAERHAEGVPIDAVVHTGDLVDDADAADASPEPTALAVARLARLPVPCLLLGGNHDRRDFLLRAAAGRGNVDVVSAPYPSADASEGAEASGIAWRAIGALRLAFVNANPEDGEGDLWGRIAPAQIEALASGIDAQAGRTAVFLHYPPLAQEAPWASPPVGGEALQAMLAPRAARVAGVFAGHAHRGIHHLADGVLHAVVPSLSRHFLHWPGQREHAAVDDAIVALHYVSVGPGGTRVQMHAFAVPEEPAQER